MAFLPEFQSKGLGTALYRDLEEKLVERKIAQIALEVNIEPPNEPSLKFHERMGFAQVGTQVTPYGTTVSLQLKRF